ncbi:ABC transporter ATP-binding protein [Horticoccus luteus]|uniref:ABC transporter ATP-binding protein n=1 Tax=Horticoccus luteus TaxID=2862869 RepID=A0A8F9XF22_9BACT|nr:ABC transporter ATP-binding protein [Horticoccus luteus]QYM77602.1 ABC transporter ATP-binding protein [Horticoccus luteus]
MVPSPPIVECRDVEKRFGSGPLVLDRVTFTAQSGDFIGLIGPSGCGKSTLLRLLAGLSPVSAGHLRIGARPPTEASAELAFVFQEPTLLPWRTAAQNVELPQQLRGVAPSARAAARQHALALVNLGDRGAAYPRQLSGGQKMRVSLARAFTLSPQILLLDEPFGALDEMTREHLNEELLTIRESQAWTAFFVTHSVAEAVFLSNRIFVFAANPGRLHREIRIDLPYPRTAATRRSRAYQDLVAEISHLLRNVETGAPA